jgi:hypothetical protein
MNAKKKTYGTPEVRTLSAAQLLESLGPVSCGSSTVPSGLADFPGVTGRVSGGNRGMN